MHTRLHARSGVRHPAAARKSLRRPDAIAWAEASPSPSPRGRGHKLRSAADHSTVCFADDHGGGTRSPLAVRPGADCGWLVGIVPLAGGLARVLGQALSAILFLYQQVLKQDIGWLHDIVRAKQPQRLPVVLTQDEVAKGLHQLSGVTWIMGTLLDGAGLRLLERLRLRVQDLDFASHPIVVRDGKG